MNAMPRKQLRTISFALERLFNPRSLLVPRSIGDFKLDNVLGRMLNLSDRRTVLLKDSGLTHFRSIVTALDQADLFDGLAGYSDYWEACRHVVEQCLSNGVIPDDANEYVELIRSTLDPKIKTYNYAVAIYGVELEGIDTVSLGDLRIVRPSATIVKAGIIEHPTLDLDRSIDAMGPNLWLVGTARGTARVAESRFRAQASLATGMLAIVAASMHEGGASAFRIGVIMSPEQGGGRSVWLSWTNEDRSLITTIGGGRAQPFRLDAKLLSQLQTARYLEPGLALLALPKKNALQKAVTRAVYWFAEAHRDFVPVMQLVKYWSCVEVFFTGDKQDITRSIATGLAAVLVYGGYQFVPEEDYLSLKRRIAKLYNPRSRALHGGAHSHVSELDAAELSQWVAWMLITIFALADDGFTTPEQIGEAADQLDALTPPR